MVRKTKGVCEHCGNTFRDITDAKIHYILTHIEEETYNRAIKK